MGDCSLSFPMSTGALSHPTKLASCWECGKRLPRRIRKAQWCGERHHDTWMARRRRSAVTSECNDSTIN